MRRVGKEVQVQRIKLIAVAFLVTSFLILNAKAQTGAAQPTNLALEIQYYPGEPPSYLTVPPADSRPTGAWYGRFKRAPDWKPPLGSQPVYAVNIQPICVGD